MFVLICCVFIRPASVKKKGLHGKSSKKTEPHAPPIGSVPAAETESLSTSVNEEGGITFDCGDEETLETGTLASYVDLHSEAVFTINLGEHGQPFKTTYC